mgnify:FL=1
MAVLTDILAARREGRKLLALLLDPEKADLEKLPLSGSYLPGYVFVGGSTGGNCDAFVAALRRRTNVPIVLFPGSALQFSPAADALLFLSLLSGRNAETLVGQQVRAARAVRRSGIESIPMGYILIDGGKETAVQRVTHTQPIEQSDIVQIVDTAIAAELLGKQLVYLEAGSGAVTPVDADIIRAVRKNTHIPLIVGGGIRTTEQMTNAFGAGADMVVIGNHFEFNPEELPAFCQAVRQYSQRNI